jgi:HK97 family phage prohead protease
MSEREIRISTSLRAVSRNDKKTLSGRAAAFGKISEDLGGFREIIKPGCFTNAMKRGDETIFCFNHQPSTIMARTRNGSLRLRQSDEGLDFEADLPDTTTADDVYALVKGGLVTECSFAFRTDKDSWPSLAEAMGMFSATDFASAGFSSSSDRNVPIRVLEDLTLYDTSVVCSPAYGNGATNVAAYPEISSVDPAATRPHMEGASVPQSVLIEARKRGRPLGGFVQRDPEHQRLLAKARAVGKRIAWEFEEK